MSVSVAEPRLHAVWRELPRGTADLVVVGGGIVGCATAYFAARAGLRVAVLEARPQLATLTTAVSTGAFRLQFDNAEEIALVREGVELFEAFPERTGLDGWDLGLRRQGYLFCALRADAVARAQRLVERQHGWGLDVELLDGDEARARFPFLSPSVRQARFRAGDGWLDPRRLALGYATAASHPARSAGAEGAGRATFHLGLPVTGFVRDGPRVSAVETPLGRVAATRVVIATGPFLAATAALAGVTLDLRPTIRQRLVVPELPSVPADAPMTIEDETGAHWRPALHGAFGLWTAADTPSGPPLEDVPVSADWVFGLLDPASDHALARVAPFWADAWRTGGPSWLTQAGQYEYTPDRRPYVGPTDVEGLWLNGGYSGHGIMASAGASRLLVDLMLGRDAPAAAAFRVDRAMLDREYDVL